MRILNGVGVEYGIDWVIEHLISEGCTSIDTDEIFESMIEDCYSETTTVGFMELSTVTVMREQDPIAWDIAKGEYIDGLTQDDEIVEIKSVEYWKNDILDFISENEV